eukprot:1144315-Rhodomonas_salina.1
MVSEVYRELRNYSPLTAKSAMRNTLDPEISYEKYVRYCHTGPDNKALAAVLEVSCTGLRTSYSMPGTDLGYTPTECQARTWSVELARPRTEGEQQRVVK